MPREYPKFAEKCNYLYALIFSVDSLDKLRTKLAQVEQDTLRDPTKFRDLYIFSFAYAKNPTQKGIEMEMAIPYWNILLQGRFQLLPLWTQFLQVNAAAKLLQCYSILNKIILSAISIWHYPLISSLI